MINETFVRPERYVKVCMALAALSLVTIAICQVIQVTRPAPQPVTRRPVFPMENRMMQQGMPPMPPGMMPPGGPQGGQGMAEGMRPPQGIPPGQPPEKPVKK